MPNPPTTILIVDAFAAGPFAGNPAAVCLLTEPQSDQWMQQVAQEMNLSETAFLFPEENGYRLRWFTPAAEIELCGHATLASAHVLWSESLLAPDETARFFTLSGELRASRRGELIELDFPARTMADADPPAGLAAALGVDIQRAVIYQDDCLVELANELTVRGLQPDFTALGKLPVRVLTVTARSEGTQYDFVSRVFVPALGIDEDPVTGAAHTYLGPYWRELLGKDEFAAYQASARGGEVAVRLLGDRVFLGGRAVTVLRGEFLV